MEQQCALLAQKLTFRNRVQMSAIGGKAIGRLFVLELNAGLSVSNPLRAATIPLRGQ
jgi:hypothetical protein